MSTVAHYPLPSRYIADASDPRRAFHGRANHLFAHHLRAPRNIADAAHAERALADGPDDGAGPRPVLSVAHSTAYLRVAKHFLPARANVVNTK